MRIFAEQNSPRMVFFGSRHLTHIQIQIFSGTLRVASSKQSLEANEGFELSSSATIYDLWWRGEVWIEGVGGTAEVEFSGVLDV
jgi:hypothetical protein